MAPPPTSMRCSPGGADSGSCVAAAATRRRRRRRREEQWSGGCAAWRLRERRRSCLKVGRPPLRFDSQQHHLTGGGPSSPSLASPPPPPPPPPPCRRRRRLRLSSSAQSPTSPPCPSAAAARRASSLPPLGRRRRRDLHGGSVCRRSACREGCRRSRATRWPRLAGSQHAPSSWPHRPCHAGSGAASHAMPCRAVPCSASPCHTMPRLSCQHRLALSGPSRLSASPALSHFPPHRTTRRLRAVTRPPRAPARSGWGRSTAACSCGTAAPLPHCTAARGSRRRRPQRAGRRAPERGCGGAREGDFAARFASVTPSRQLSSSGRSVDLSSNPALTHNALLSVAAAGSRDAGRLRRSRPPEPRDAGASKPKVEEMEREEEAAPDTAGRDHEHDLVAATASTTPYTARQRQASQGR